MEKHPSREALLQRITTLEAALQRYGHDVKPTCSAASFCLDDFEHAADGICVCHAIETFPHVRFTFWNRRMVDLTGYQRETINRNGWHQSVYPDPDMQAKAMARMAEMRVGQNLEAEEWEITRADGAKRIMRISTSVLDPGDETPRVMAIMHDVTERRRNEAILRKEQQDLRRELTRQSTSLADSDMALKASEEKYRGLFHHSNDAIFIHDLEGNILDVNQKTLALLGYTKSEMASIKIPMLHPAGELEKSKWAFETILREGSVTFETAFLNKKGDLISAEISSSLFVIGGNQVIQGIVHDIRERKLAEQARREAYDIIEKSPVSAFLWHNETDWPVEYVTTNVERIFGYSADDFLTGRVVYRHVVHAQDIDRVTHEVTTASQAPDRTEFTHEPYRIVAKDGTIRWVNDHTFIRRDHTGAITHYQGIVEDITARLTAALALQESEAKFSRIFQLSPDPVMITRLKDGQILDVNNSFLEVSGYSHEEVIGRLSVQDLNLWANPLERQRYAEVIVQDGFVRHMELEFRMKNGDIRLGSICGELLELGGERYVFGTMRDITDERLAANQLAAEKERLGVTLRCIGDAVITTDREGRIALMNPIAENLTGWCETDAMGLALMDVFRIVNERTQEPCANPVEKVLATGQIVGLANHTMLIAKDGREFIIADSGAPILDRQGVIIGVVLVFRDITGQQHIEKELLKMEKMQSLGVLAGGIAHDFNNFLTGIIGNLSLAKFEIQPGHPVSRALDEMEKAAVRAKGLTQQLLTFSKGGKPVKHTASMADLTHESTRFALRGSNVRSDLKFEEAFRPADIDEGQMTQVLHNLIINADQAMPDGGTITIRGTNVSLPPDNPYALRFG